MRRARNDSRCSAVVAVLISASTAPRAFVFNSLTPSTPENDAKAVATLVEANFPRLNGKVEINYVGTTIGSHTGPGTVALFFWGGKRE